MSGRAGKTGGGESPTVKIKWGGKLRRGEPRGKEGGKTNSNKNHYTMRGGKNL